MGYHLLFMTWSWQLVQREALSCFTAELRLVGLGIRPQQQQNMTTAMMAKINTKTREESHNSPIKKSKAVSPIVIAMSKVTAISATASVVEVQ